MKRLLCAGVLVLGLLASCSSSVESGSFTVIAGLNDPDDPTIGIVQYLPQSITIDKGSVVTWLIDGPEPHSVTFFPVGERRAPEGRFSFDPIPPEGPFDGTTTISSGLEPRTSPVEFSVAFDTVGTFGYFCVIHGRMNGRVEVVDGGGESQEDIDTRATFETAEYLEEGRRAKAAFVASGATARELDDGRTEWVVDTGFDTNNTTILAFAPDSLVVAPGDSITFANNSRAPHTATFLGGEPLPAWFDASSTPRQPGVRGAELVAAEFLNTGTLLWPGVGGITNWSFRATEPGTFTYFCLYHSPSQMVGTVVVEG